MASWGPLASELAAVFPGATEASWKRRDHPEQAARLGQLQRKAFEDVPGALRHLLSEFSGMAFIDFLESLTGVQGLIPDPHFRGAGLHLTLRGGIWRCTPTSTAIASARSPAGSPSSTT